jgi:hypothetical protein
MSMDAILQTVQHQIIPGEVRRARHTRPAIDLSVAIRAKSRRVLYAITIPEYMEAWLQIPSTRRIRVIPDPGDPGDLRLERYNSSRPSGSIAIAVDHVSTHAVSMKWRESPIRFSANSMVSITLRGAQDKCLLRLRHKGLMSQEARRWYSEMWQQSLANLCSLLGN